RTWPARTAGTGGEASLAPLGGLRYSGEERPGAQAERRAKRTRFLPFWQQNQVARGSGEAAASSAPRRRAIFLNDCSRRARRAEVPPARPSRGVPRRPPVQVFFHSGKLSRSWLSFPWNSPVSPGNRKAQA